MIRLRLISLSPAALIPLRRQKRPSVIDALVSLARGFYFVRKSGERCPELNGSTNAAIGSLAEEIEQSPQAPGLAR